MIRFLFILILFLQIRLDAAEAVDITQHDFDGKSFGRQSYWYIGDKGINELSSPQFQDNFSIGQKEIHSFGMKSHTFWVKISFSNPLSAEKQLYIFDTQNYSHEVSVYKDGRFLSSLTHEDSLRKRIIRVALPPETTTILYIKKSEFGAQNQTWTYWLDKEKLLHNIRDSERNWIILMSVFAMSLLFNCMLFYSYRTKLYIFYISYLVVFSISTTALWSIIGTSYMFHIVTATTVLTGISAILFTIEFLNLRRDFAKCYNLLRFLLLGAGFSLAPLLVSKPFLTNQLITAITGIGALSCFLIAVFVSYRRREAHIFIYIAGYGTFLAGAIFQQLLNQGEFPSLQRYDRIVFYAGALENILMLIAMGYRINRTERERIESHNELKKYVGKVEVLVDEKTRHISSIMKHIKQGIFVILPDLSIEKNYSHQFEKIVGRHSLTGMNPIDLFLKPSNLSQDEISKINSTLVGSLGDNSLNFQLNRCHLPHEIIYNNKNLELDWQNIDDENDTTEKILVVVRDITRLKILEEQNQVHKEEMIRIEEILKLPTDKCQDFFDQCQQFLDEVIRLIQANPEFSEQALQTVFINYHTMKGLSRGFGLKILTDALHTAEDYCSSLRKAPDQWDQKKLLSDYDIVEESLRRYTDLSQGKLGRSGVSGRVIDCKIIESTIDLLDELPSQLKNKYHILDRVFHRSLYIPARDLFDDIFSQIHPLAKELGKDSPEIRKTCSEVMISPKGVALLTNIFTHLIRNSLDHGIEYPDARTALGKDSAGTMRLKVESLNEALVIHFADDGAGLNLSKIKALGIRKGLLLESENDPCKIVDLMFIPGFSTAEEVTAISGRGVGMGAIRSYTEEAGGTLDVNFLSNVKKLDQPVEIEFVITLDSRLFYLPK